MSADYKARPWKAADGMLLAALIRLARRECDMVSADLKVVAGLAVLGVLLTLL